MREVVHNYPEREDGVNADNFLAFQPKNAVRIVSEINSIQLSDLGEGESILEDKDGVVTRYSKIKGKIFKEDTIIQEI